MNGAGAGTEVSFAVVVGRQLRALRVAAGLSQEKLARKVEMSKETVRRIEAGESTTTATIDLILQTLGVTGPDLMPTDSDMRVWRKRDPALLAA